MLKNRLCSRVAALILSALLAVCIPLSVCAQEESAYDADNPQNLTAENIVGKAAVLMDEQTGTVLFEKNAYRKTYPASTTKIMTCLVALENFPNLNQLVTVGPEAKNVPGDSSLLNIKEGEQYPMIDLLYGMMMRSGNDAAMTIAVAVAGSVDEFVNMMNDKAQSLGCKDTHFANPHGYHNEAHVTTAYDLALITRAAMQNRIFRDIASAKSYTMSATSLREKWRVETSNPMFVATSKYYYPDLIGVKTGYHSKAGRCFVGAANKQGVEMISVVLKSKNDVYWTDTARLFDYGITRYETLTFSQMFDKAPIFASIKNASVNDEGAGLLRLQVVPGTALDTYTVKCLPENRDRMLSRFGEDLTIDYTSDLTAPIEAGDILGTITMDVNERPVTATVVASRSVEAEPVPFTLQSLMPNLSSRLGSVSLWLVIGAILLIVCLILVLRARAARRRRAMMRRRRAAYNKYRRM